MISTQRTTPDDPLFRSLVVELDEDLRNRYGAKQSEYDVHNTGLEGACVVLALKEGKPVGCGCFKAFGGDTAELKRMYVQPASRRLGAAQRLLTELERWAAETGYANAILQTAIKQPEAIALYQACGYRLIDRYGVYAGDEDSVCLGKRVDTQAGTEAGVQ